MKSKSFLYFLRAASASSMHNPQTTCEVRAGTKVTIEREVRTPRLSCQLLLPLVVFLNRVLPVLLSLYILERLIYLSNNPVASNAGM